MNISANFVTGTPEGASIITYSDGTKEKVYLHHGVPVGLGIITKEQRIVRYNDGKETKPTWRFGIGIYVIGLEMAEGSGILVFVNVLGSERTVLVKDRDAYEVKGIEWICKGGLLDASSVKTGNKLKLSVIEDFPSVVAKKDELLYHMVKIYVWIIHEKKKSEGMMIQINEGWIQEHSRVREQERLRKNVVGVTQKVDNGNNVKSRSFFDWKKHYFHHQ